jgi:hypothetical protein
MLSTANFTERAILRKSLSLIVDSEGLQKR